MYEDNDFTFKWSSGHVSEDLCRSKDVDLRYHHVCEKWRDKTVRLTEVSTTEMIEDFLNRPLYKTGILLSVNKEMMIFDTGETMKLFFE